MHICSFNNEFLGLGYDFYKPTFDNYGVMTFELYQCKRCKRLTYRNILRFDDTWNDIHYQTIEKIKKAGYKSIGELLV